jgi:glycosyltransferase involved in cell wall biosynthesis
MGSMPETIFLESQAARSASPNVADAVVLHTRVVTQAGGGPDKTILNSPRFLHGTGYRVLCAYMHPPGDAGFEELRRKAAQWQTPLLSVADRGPLDWQVVWHLAQICRRHRVTIWHGHDYKSNLLGLLVRMARPLRLVTTVHGWVKETRRTPLYYGIDRLCLPYYERVICVSEDLQARCLAARVPATRCVLIENAIDTEDFRRRQTPAQAKALLGLPADRLLVGAVGRLSAEKGFDLLIRAVDQLLQQNLKVDLCIVGEGDDEARLRSLISQLGRDQHIRLLGYRSDTKNLYQAMDVFALSSLREGLPNVLLEAMALEVPIVATRIAGIPRLIQHGCNGLLVDPGNTVQLAAALHHLLGDEDLRARLRLQGRETVERRYSFHVRMHKIRALYDDLLGRKPIPERETPS